MAHIDFTQEYLILFDKQYRGSIIQTMKKLILLLLVFTTQSYALGPIDVRLQGYIKTFNLAPQKAPKPRNDKLFILGRNLFMDQRLSGNNNISCMECHHPRVGTGDGIPLSLGEGANGFQFNGYERKQGTARVLARNAPAIMNLHNVPVLFWDGRVMFSEKSKTFSTPVPLRAAVSKVMTSALAAQAIFPMVDHDEMRGLKGSNPIADAKDEYEAWDLIVKKIMAIDGYRKLFEEVFPGQKINIGHFGEALGEFQSHAFFLADTPYDRYISGRIEALNPKQKEGMDVFFGKGKCGECHNGELLTDLSFKNVGVPQIGPGKEKGMDFGRYQWDKNEANRFAFRVPPLRNVAITGPYFHDGSFETLEEVVEHYDDIKASLESFRILKQWTNYVTTIQDHDQRTNHLIYATLPDILPLKLEFTEEEEEALVEFIKTGLTDIRLQ